MKWVFALFKYSSPYPYAYWWFLFIFFVLEQSHTLCFQICVLCQFGIKAAGWLIEACGYGSKASSPAWSPSIGSPSRRCWCRKLRRQVDFLTVVGSWWCGGERKLLVFNSGKKQNQKKSNGSAFNGALQDEMKISTSEITNKESTTVNY